MGIKQEFNKIIKQLEPHSLKTVKIKPLKSKPDTIWNSKFSGTPYWPKNKEYPTTKNGEPLHLLAQINFEETPKLEGYPEKGLLQFFIAADDLYGLDFDTPIEKIISEPDGYRVIYHSDIIKDNTQLENDLPVIDEDAYLPASGEYALSFELSDDMPSASDYRFEKYVGDIFELDDELGEYIYDNLFNDGSKIGGYAYFTQEDPRSYQKEGENWILLFQMDTEDEDGIDIMWGDCGVGNFFIEPERLANCDFSRVWYNWDCC